MSSASSATRLFFFSTRCSSCFSHSDFCCSGEPDEKRGTGGPEASHQGHRSPEHEEWNLLWAGAQWVGGSLGAVHSARGRGAPQLILPELHSLLWFLKASSTFIPSASSSLRAASISFSRRWMLWGGQDETQKSGLFKNGALAQLWSPASH